MKGKTLKYFFVILVKMPSIFIPRVNKCKLTLGIKIHDGEFLQEKKKK